MNDESFPGRFAAANRPGVYLRIIHAGVVRAGDVVRIDPAERPAVSIHSLLGDDVSVEVLRAVAVDPRVPEDWRRAAARTLARARA